MISMGADTSRKGPVDVCTWSQHCRERAQFFVPQDLDDVPEPTPSPDVCARHLGQAVKTSAVQNHQREIPVFVA